VAKVVIFFEQPTHLASFEKHYYEVHLPIAKKVLGVMNMYMNRVLHTAQLPEGYAQPYLVSEIEFVVMDTMQRVLAGPEWGDVLADAPNLFAFLPKPPLVLLVDSK